MIIKRHKKGILNVLKHAVFLILIYFFQGIVFSRLRIFGSAPMIFPAAVVGIALYGGSVRGSVFGLFAGILCDISMNETIALFTVVLTIIGFTVGLLSESVITRTIVSYILLVIAALCITAFLQMFSLLFFVGAGRDAIARTAMLQVLVSAIFMVPVYPCVLLLSSRRK